jgi:hypothetical protein
MCPTTRPTFTDSPVHVSPPPLPIPLPRRLVCRCISCRCFLLRRLRLLHYPHMSPPEETFHDPPPSSLLQESDKGCAGCILYDSTPFAGSILLSMLLPPRLPPSELPPVCMDAAVKCSFCSTCAPTTGTGGPCLCRQVRTSTKDMLAVPGPRPPDPPNAAPSHCAPAMELLLRQGQPSWPSREQSVSSVFITTVGLCAYFSS